jgi:chorismate mutase
MTAVSSSLDALRRDIDRIDDALATLLAERASVVTRVAEIKSKDATATTPMRPGREAAVVRRRVEAGAGALPPFVLARLWREMIAAFCRVQGPLSVAVCAPQKSVGYWDIARDHFGSATPMTLHRSPNLVLRAVAEGSVTAGVLPMPEDAEDDPWWMRLAGSDASQLRVIARLPFCQNPDGRFEDLESLVIARFDIEESGDDQSLFAVAASAEISRDSLNVFIAEAGFEGQGLATQAVSVANAPRHHLIDVAGFVGNSDPRLAALGEKIGGTDGPVLRVGGYATPMAPPPAA